jgi:tetratricopeptide (TPR) repeat protein
MSEQIAAAGPPAGEARTAGAWLAASRVAVLRGDTVAALATQRAGVAAHPADPGLQHALAGVAWQAGHAAEAEALLRDLLGRRPDHAASAFLLARLLKSQDRMLGVETTLRTLFRNAPQDTATLIAAIELLDDCGRKQAAADLVEAAIAQGASDPRLHAYAGMLAMQLGAFDRARRRYRHTLEHDPRALAWESAYGYAVSTRYTDPGDPDFAFLRGLLAREGHSTAARASLLFALGKMHDDVGDAAHAATCLREATTLARAGRDWSRRNWRRLVAARLAAPELPPLAAVDDDFVPVFLVGLPRSGTTLLATRLASRPLVCDRGETPWIAALAHEISRAPRPAAALAGAAAAYRRHMRQDDTDARWFIDKHPLNFQHVGLIRALFPQARIVHCRRSLRDTALSIWMQHFAGPEFAFAYDFADIAALADGCSRLMALAQRRYPDLIHDVRYEDLVRDPEGVTRAVAAWLGLPDAPDAAPAAPVVISTASAWQARQPIHTRSIGRWRAYAPFLRELTALFPE